jgi:homoserine kinase
VALRIYNRVRVTRLKEGSGVEMGKMQRETGGVFFKEAGIDAFEYGCEIDGEVPRSRGLGSSVTVRLGLLHGLNALAGEPLTGERMYEIAAGLEGHPDNAAPGAFGGFVVCGPGSWQRFEVDDELEFVLLVPPFEVSTPEARAVLPAEIARLEGVRSCANACRITAAFAARRYEKLRGCFGDGLHQPFRTKLVPRLPDVIAAGEEAGALGGFLSGSGSTICCVTLDHGEAVATAMLKACGEKHAYTLRTHADNRGVTRVEET